MFKEYLKITDPEATIDRVKMRSPTPEHLWKECPRCKGYGSFNMRINAYKLPEGKEDTPENRARFVHLTGVCSHCNGWGHIDKRISCEGHEWVHEKNLGLCYNRYRCAHCGMTNDVDTSD